MNILQHLVRDISNGIGTAHDVIVNHSPAPVRSAFSATQQLEQLPVDVVKAANRSTPWGQANQTTYNAAHTVPIALPVQRPFFLPGQLGATAAPSPTAVDISKLQGLYNPGATGPQVGGYANRLGQPNGYDQEQRYRLQ